MPCSYIYLWVDLSCSACHIENCESLALQTEHCNAILCVGLHDAPGTVSCLHSSTPSRYGCRRLSTGFSLFSDIMASFMRPSVGRYTLLPSASSCEDVSVESHSVLCSMDGRGMYEWCGLFFFCMFWFRDRE